MALSQVGKIQEAVNAVAESVVPGLQTGVEPVNIDSLPADAYPFGYSVPVDGAALDALDYLQDDETIPITFVLVLNRDTETYDLLLKRLEDIKVAIYADRTLGGIVDGRTRVVTSAPDHIQGEKRWAGTVTVQTFRVN